MPPCYYREVRHILISYAPEYLAGKTLFMWQVSKSYGVLVKNCKGFEISSNLQVAIVGL